MVVTGVSVEVESGFANGFVDVKTGEGVVLVEISARIGKRKASSEKVLANRKNFTLVGCPSVRAKFNPLSPEGGYHQLPQFSRRFCILDDLKPTASFISFSNEIFS